MCAVVRVWLVSLFAVCWSGTLLASDPHKLETFKGPAPKGLSEKIAAQLDENAYRIVGPNGPVLELWLVKEAATKDDFKSTLMVKYPFTSGQLLGAVNLPKAGAALDFRGQELPAGVYTLRYGLQPQDGNHVGTSDTRDFLVLLPPAEDKQPGLVAKESMFKLSREATGTTHPGILSLLASPGKLAAPR